MSYTNTSSNAGTASVLYNNDMWFGTVTQLLAVCPTPANARYGREYFVTSLGYAVISDGAQWLSPLRIRAIGTTTERDAITYKPTGYKFSNTTTGTIQTWSGSAWV